jgi:hypothetical protein
MFLRVDAHTVRQILHDTCDGSVEARTLFLGGMVGGMVGMRVDKMRPNKKKGNEGRDVDGACYVYACVHSVTFRF